MVFAQLATAPLMVLDAQIGQWLFYRSGNHIDDATITTLFHRRHHSKGNFVIGYQMVVECSDEFICFFVVILPEAGPPVLLTRMLTFYLLIVQPGHQPLQECQSLPWSNYVVNGLVEGFYSVLKFLFISGQGLLKPHCSQLMQQQRDQYLVCCHKPLLYGLSGCRVSKRRL